MVRRGERPLRRHLGEITKPGRGSGCLRTDLVLVELQIASVVVKVVLCYVKFTTGAISVNVTLLTLMQFNTRIQPSHRH